MKKSLRILILAIITGFAFSSCSNKFSITKRKYNKGYYVSHSHKRGEIKRQAQTVEVKPEAPVETETILAKPSKKQSVNNESEKQLSASISKPVEQSQVNNNSKKVYNDRQLNKKYYKIKQLENLLPSQAYSQELKKKLSADHEHDALSLLWIVIVVVLILYLLGLIFGGFGLGGAIHVLAVIFLVLLILWLLRVI